MGDSSARGEETTAEEDAETETETAPASLCSAKRVPWQPRSPFSNNHSSSLLRGDDGNAVSAPADQCAQLVACLRAVLLRFPHSERDALLAILQVCRTRVFLGLAS